MKSKSMQLLSRKNGERFLPYVIGTVLLLIVVVLLVMGKLRFDFSGGKSPYAVVMAFSSVMAAFLASVFGVFVAAKDSDVLKLFLKTHQFKLVKEYMFSAVVVNLVTTCVCLVGELGIMSDKVVVCGLVWCFSVSVLQILVLTRILKNLI